MKRFYCGSRSCFVSHVVYHPGKLTVVFKKNPHKYEYYFVPASVYKQLKGAESVGAAFVELVKDKYPCKKIRTKNEG